MIVMEKRLTAIHIFVKRRRDYGRGTETPLPALRGWCLGGNRPRTRA
jgi:hypothetical protein